MTKPKPAREPESKGGATSIAHLQYVLDHASGGGNWRRIIIERMEQLSQDEGSDMQLNNPEVTTEVTSKAPKGIEGRE